MWATVPIRVKCRLALVPPVRTPLNTSPCLSSPPGSLMHRLRTVLFAFATVAALPGIGLAQGGANGATRTTASGVYSADQANRGRDTYAMQCKSCHTPASHTGQIFAQWWDRKPLSELYQFILTRMPKNEPGSLQPDEYVDVMAYLLKLNDLPSGSDPLPADSLAMKKIRIEVGKKDP